jgi:hypothetical protein
VNGIADESLGEANEKAVDGEIVEIVLEGDVSSVLITLGDRSGKYRPHLSHEIRQSIIRSAFV